jgi:tetratricopeptide (TPR) repeat protein
VVALRELIALAVSLALAGAAHARSPVEEHWISEQVQKGIQLYGEGKMDDALKAFADAQTRNWESPEIQLDMGATMARKKDAEKARALFAKAAESKDEKLRSIALYNLGQLDLSSGQFKPAAARFRNALRLNPTDADAKHNLELALAKLEEQKQKQQQDQKNQPSPEPSPSPNPSPNPSPSPSPSPDASPSPSPSPSPNPSPSPDASPSPSPGARN